MSYGSRTRGVTLNYDQVVEEKNMSEVDEAPIQMFFDKRFPGIDVALRKGFHYTDDDMDSWQFLIQHKIELCDFYSRYNSELIFDAEGFAYLSAYESQFRQQRLKGSEMLIGQVIALFTADPTILRNGGKIKQEDLIARICHLVPNEQISYLFYAARTRRARTDLDQGKFREAVEKGIRTLEGLGFISLDKEGLIRPHRSIFRFAVLARVKENRDLVFQDLVKKGNIVTGSLDSEDFSEADEVELLIDDEAQVSYE